MLTSTKYFARRSVWLAIAALALGACDKPAAWGDANSLIVVVSDSLWAEVEEITYEILEPTVFTTREENTYNVTQVDPTHSSFRDMKVFRQVVVFGTAANPLVIEAAQEAGRVGTLEVPSVFQAKDVWSRGQTVTTGLLEEDRQVESLISQLPAVLGMVESEYRQWVLRRMFVTPPDTALAAALARDHGFSVLVPLVYDYIEREGPGEPVVILRNDNPDPSQLIRSLLVASRPTIQELTPEVALEWRAAVDSIHYNVPQRLNTERSSVTRFLADGHEALEVTGIWEDEEGDFPAAGPFVLWLVQCPSRTYMLDAYLYAPGQDKYEYMLQLQLSREFRPPAHT
jgi:hypothetical protein